MLHFKVYSCMPLSKASNLKALMHKNEVTTMHKDMFQF